MGKLREKRKMGRKKIYRTVAEKQRAWRIRTGKQKVKVPLPLRRGEKLGTSEGFIRAKKEGETWKEYHVYIQERLGKAKSATMEGGLPIENEGEESIGAKRIFGRGTEPEMSEDYYELRAKYEKDLLELENKGRKVKEK